MAEKHDDVSGAVGKTVKKTRVLQARDTDTSDGDWATLLTADADGFDVDIDTEVLEGGGCGDASGASAPSKQKPASKVPSGQKRKASSPSCNSKPSKAAVAAPRVPEPGGHSSVSASSASFYPCQHDTMAQKAQVALCDFVSM